MSTRRAFLGTLGKLLGAGGVLLPLAGKGALALPTDLGKAAALPVTATPLPISPELVHLREIRRELHGIYLSDTSDGRTEAWRDVMVNHHRPTEARIIGRETPTWRDCVEIAEVCMHRLIRETRYNGLDPTNPLHALVWGVLSAGGTNEVYIPEFGDMAVDEAKAVIR